VKISIQRKFDRRMIQDSEHLQLLAIFHYVVAGLATLLYSVIGRFLLTLLNILRRVIK